MQFAFKYVMVSLQKLTQPLYTHNYPSHEANPERFMFLIVPLDIQYEWYHSPYKGQTDIFDQNDSAILGAMN